MLPSAPSHSQTLIFSDEFNGALNSRSFGPGADPKWQALNLLMDPSYLSSFQQDHAGLDGEGSLSLRITDESKTVPRVTGT